MATSLWDAQVWERKHHFHTRDAANEDESRGIKVIEAGGYTKTPPAGTRIEDASKGDERQQSLLWSWRSSAQSKRGMRLENRVKKTGKEGRKKEMFLKDRNQDMQNVGSWYRFMPYFEEFRR